MPKINLKPLEYTVVNTRTQAEFDELIKVYKSAGWKAYEYTSNLWQTHKEKTSVEVKDGYSVYTIDSSPKFHETVITLDEFKQIQGIESENQMEDIDAKMEKYGVERFQYKVGDVLINSDGRQRLVLAVSGYACLLSQDHDYVNSGCWYTHWYTQYELDRNGWKLYTETPEPTKTKLTLQQIADKFGMSVDEIEIESSDENN